jgi:hypothetical protein
MAQTLNLYQGESKVIKIRIVDNITKQPIPLTGCTFSLKIVGIIHSTKIIEKDDADFDKTLVANGIIKFPLSDGDLDTLGKFTGQLTITFPNDEIDKSNIFYLYIIRAI